jgi:predicted metal-binding protein
VEENLGKRMNIPFIRETITTAKQILKRWQQIYLFQQRIISPGFKNRTDSFRRMTIKF